MIILRNNLNLLDNIKIIPKDRRNVITLKHSITGFSKFLSKFFKSIKNSIEENPYFDILINNEKIGELNLSIISNTELNIVWIEIRDDYRGRGYAQSILKSLIKFAKENKFKKITLEVPGVSPDAKHIYEKLGFKDIGKIDSKDDDIFWGGLSKMELNL